MFAAYLINNTRPSLPIFAKLLCYFKVLYQHCETEVKEFVKNLFLPGEREKLILIVHI